MNISNDYPQKWIDLGYGLDFNFNIKKTVTGYEYDTIFVQKKERDLLIQSLIHYKYSIYDEIALVNNYNTGLNIEEYNQYQEYRIWAKELASKEF